MKRLYRIREVKEMTGLGQSTIYRRIAAGDFPAPVSISPRLVAWRQEDLDAWKNQLKPAGAGCIDNANWSPAP